MTARPGLRSPVAGLGLLLLLFLALPSEASENGRLLERYFEVWNGADTAGLDSIVAEGFVRHGGYGSAESRAELQEMITGFRGFYRDLEIEVEEIIATADKAAVRWRFSGGYGDTSFEMNSLNFGMYRIVDGLITEEWVVGNTVDYWTGMGYRLMPPGTRMIPPPPEASPEDDPRPPAIDRAVLAAAVDEARARVSPKAGSIEITAEVDCRLTLDSTKVGWLARGQTTTVPAEPGSHLLTATSRGGSVFFSESVEVKKRKATAIVLKSPGRVIVYPQSLTTEDLETGLMWQMSDNGGDISQGRAAGYCAALTQGGYTDWRLPSIFELERLYAPETAGTRRFHTIPGVTLTGCCPWTATPHGDFHWTFVFYNGLRYIKYRSIGKFSRALCVRETWGSG